MSKLYELTYIYDGPERKRYSLGNYSLKPNIPFFLYEEELPLSVRQIKKLKDIQIKVVKFKEKPNPKFVEAKARGSAGLVWDGPSPFKTTIYGKFKRGEVDYSLSKDVLEFLAKKTGFKVVDK